MTSDGLLAVIEVPYESRVCCMAPSCGHSVYKRIHIVRQSGQLLILGSSCFSRIYAGQALATSSPRLTSTAGRQLTQEERDLLAGNTERLIEKFEIDQQTETKRRDLEQRQAPHPTISTPNDEDFFLFNRQLRGPARENRNYTSFRRRPDPFTPAQRASVEPEARAKLNSELPGIDLDSPGFNGLLQSEIDRILRGRMA